MQQLNIVIRVDATANIGTGHFMRCLTLAEELKKQGCRIRFVSRDLLSHLCSLLEVKGMEFIVLNNETSSAGTDELAHSAWLGTSQSQDANETLVAIADHVWDWMVVDHYALDARWESAIRKQAKQIMVIDDIADRQHDCDVLLDQNYYRDMQTRYDGKVPERCLMLVGPHYALLREEFRILRAQTRQRTGEVRRILVFFGGVDAGNYTALAIEALSGLDIKDVAVDVVIGAQHPRRAEIEQACAIHCYACHVQTSRMAELMASADLAIGAGGSATWERCCLGLPALSICTAENQSRQVLDAAEAGILYTPSGECDLVNMLRRHVSSLLGNSALLKLISNTAMKAVDGRGASRVIGEIASLGNRAGVDNVFLRPAVAEDAKVAWPWRKSESTRRYFFDPSSISLDTHMAWWNRSIGDPQRKLLIGYFEGCPFGVIRFDFNEPMSAVISIYIDPDMTGKGRGQKLLRAGLGWLRENYPSMKSVLAEILPENAASVRAFQSVGFTEKYRVLVLTL